MKISFCTWIKSRLWQFRQTVFHNLRESHGRGFDVEFVVVDAASPDGLAEWLDLFLATEIKNGLVRVVTRPEEPVHHPTLKNASHFAAAGEILVNLDCDNLLGPKYCEWLLSSMKRDVVGHAWSGNWGDGTFGRLALRRETFREIGGYDESLGPVGGQDIDLRDRAKASGRRYVATKSPDVVGGAVRNSREQKMLHIAGRYDDINTANSEQSKRNIRAGKIIANQGRGSGVGG